jgi:uncharacterized membrane protein
MAVHFPIALLLSGWLFEVTGFFINRQIFHKTAFYLLVMGMLGTAGSWFVGRAAGSGMDDGALNKAMELHERAATLSLWLSITSVLIYAGIYIFKYNQYWLRTIAVVVFTGLAASIARTGYLGGQLVYKHGAGVELSLPDFQNPDEK